MLSSFSLTIETGFMGVVTDFLLTLHSFILTNYSHMSKFLNPIWTPLSVFSSRAGCNRVIFWHTQIFPSSLLFGLRVKKRRKKLTSVSSAFKNLPHTNSKPNCLGETVPASWLKLCHSIITSSIWLLRKETNFKICSSFSGLSPFWLRRALKWNFLLKRFELCVWIL